MNVASILSGICFSTLLVVGACGNFVALEEASDAGLADAPPMIDAVPATDADPSLCSPVTQQGCAAGQKCAQVVESDDPFLAGTTCVPEGSVAKGGACSRGGAGPDGYDDCLGGLHCSSGVCAEICSQSPDTCPTGGGGAFEADHCSLFENIFEGSLGLCVSACDPTDDTVDNGTLDNADCPANQGCYLDLTSGATSCANVLVASGQGLQNQSCLSPGGAGCYLNGCASGFAPYLSDSALNPTVGHCARFCVPRDTHIGATTAPGGFLANCETPNLEAVGGTAGNTSEHQCRFLQTLYTASEQVPAEAGICVPVVDATGDLSYGDCLLLDWDGIQNAWNSAAPSGQAAADAALEDFCFATPGEPSSIFPKCLGFFRGCISSAERESGLTTPAPTP